MRTRGALLALALCLAGCGWRLAAPAESGTALQLRVMRDGGRLPAAAAALQAAVAARVHEATGWELRGDGPRRLDLAIVADDYAAVGHDERGIPSRWRYRLEVSALLVTPEGHRAWQGQGLGYAATRAQEPAMLAAAADEVALALARWVAAGP